MKKVLSNGSENRSTKELYSNLTDKQLMNADIPKDPKESKRFKPNMQLAALRKDTIVTDWLDNYPQATQSVYLTYMNEFLETTGYRPKDLLPMETSDLKKHILRVVDGMKDANRYYAAKHLMKAITSFALHYEKVVNYPLLKDVGLFLLQRPTPGHLQA